MNDVVTLLVPTEELYRAIVPDIAGSTLKLRAGRRRTPTQSSIGCTAR